MFSFITITVLTVVVAYIGYHLYKESVMASYEKYTKTVLENAYTITTDYSFGDLISARNMTPEYEEMRERLNRIKENSDISYLYAVYFEDIDDIHSLTYAINTKTSEELANGGLYTYLGTTCEEGSFEDETLYALQDAVKSRRQESSVLDGYSEEYGHMLNGYKVIFDSEGNPAGLLCVEIDIKNDISKETNKYLRTIAIVVTLFAVVITGIYIAIIEYFLIYPITSITNAANDFVTKIDDYPAMGESAKKLEQKNIRARNEVGELYTSVSKMETAMAKQLHDIMQYAENTLKMKDGLMILMADMVEVRDSDTGEHIQKTAAYVKIILEGLARKGYYTDILTPKYIEDVVKSAPLHDIGKIKISDVILNKPEKLTSDEFETMKTHTTLGRAIIDKASQDIEDDGFLLEARNMASSHHERWDGKGYPEGLQGEAIPLSARIMAVADVFDALTSPRVYKPAFPFSKSVQIIEEGKGTQFDPKCVEVFIEALPEVEEILIRLNPGYEPDKDENDFKS